MKRIKYYVIHCTEKERDNGKDNYEQFNSLSLAMARAKELAGISNEFISVERHHEIFTRNEWLPDWDMGDKWNETIEI